MKSTAPLAQRKKPKDDGQHLTQSLTHQAVAGEDYGALIAKRGFKHRQPRHEQELADQAKHAGFWQTLEHEIAVKKTKHRRSPYVVRLQTSPASGPVMAAPEDEEWRKEVERLRRDGASLGNRRSAKVRVNFLALGVSLGAAKFLSWSFFKWLIDLALSIPLGFLLILHVILKLTEWACNLTVRAGRFFGRAVAGSIEAIFLTAIVVVKTAVALPIKIVVLFFLSLYRVLSWLVLGVGRLFQVAAEILAHPLSALKTRPRLFWGQVAATAALAGLILGPLKFVGASVGDIRVLRGQVLGAAKEGLGALSGLKNSVSQGQAEAAKESLQTAGLKFGEARASLDQANIVLRSLIKLTPQGQSGDNLLAAGQALAQAGEEITIALAPFLSHSGQTDVISAVNNLSISLGRALPFIVNARQSLDQVDIKSIPEEYRSQLANTQKFLPPVAEALTEFTKLADALLILLGSDGEKHYAVLFQNNNELRPAGGFIGSLALMTVRAGRITQIDIPGGGSYDFQGSLTKHVIAPKPLSLINPHWQMQDANWYPDWPTSAEKVAWFLENSGQTSVDGVIALQATTFADLLRLLGPIEFPEYNVTLNADNVLAEIQTAVEVNYDKAKNKPKQYIAELAPRMIDKILGSTSDQFLEIMDLVKNEVEEKNILLYFRDQNINQQFLDRGWEPTIAPSQLDYLSVINANIGGGKTDGAIEQEWRQNITISADGTAVAELTISRHHRGQADDQFAKSNNVDFVRVYAPLGSELISAQGFKAPAQNLFEKPADFYEPDEQLAEIEGKVLIDETTGTRINNEFSKTVFGNWIQVGPGKTAVATVRYKLPFKIKPETGGYSLIMQKQVGARPLNFSVAIVYPAAWQVAWHKTGGEPARNASRSDAGGGTIETNARGLVTFTGVLRKDTGFAVLFTEER